MEGTLTCVCLGRVRLFGGLASRSAQLPESCDRRAAHRRHDEVDHGAHLPVRLLHMRLERQPSTNVNMCWEEAHVEQRVRGQARWNCVLFEEQKPEKKSHDSAQST